MRQAAFLLKVDPIAVDFDMNQDVYLGKMKPIECAEGIDFGGGQGEADQEDVVVVGDVGVGDT